MLHVRRQGRAPGGPTVISHLRFSKIRVTENGARYDVEEFRSRMYPLSRSRRDLFGIGITSIIQVVPI